jgi:hypothetical protein
MTVPTRKTRLFMRRDVRRVAFVDKLRQRWIVERAGSTLYQLAIDRLRDDLNTGALVSELERFGEQEQLHAAMLEQLLGELGHADPRHEPATLGVNIAASQMASLVDLMRGRQLTSRHVLEILLMAERLDLAGWELLTDLAKEADLDDEYLRSFRAAGREEAAHEHFVRTHLVQLEREMLFSGGSPPP